MARIEMIQEKVFYETWGKVRFLSPYFVVYLGAMGIAVNMYFFPIGASSTFWPDFISSVLAWCLIFLGVTMAMDGVR